MILKNIPKFGKIEKISYNSTDLVIDINNKKYYILDVEKIGKRESVFSDSIQSNCYGHYKDNTYTDLLLATARCKNEKTREFLKKLLKERL